MQTQPLFRWRTSLLLGLLGNLFLLPGLGQALAGFRRRSLVFMIPSSILGVGLLVWLSQGLFEIAGRMDPELPPPMIDTAWSLVQDTMARLHSPMGTAVVWAMLLFSWASCADLLFLRFQRLKSMARTD